jgi:hypothetical protein
MKSTFVIGLAGALLLSLSAAHAQSPGGKAVSRDQLRACMDSESDLAARRSAIETRRTKNGEEAAAIKAEAADLAAEQKRVEDDASGMGRRERFERKVKAHNARVKAAQAGAESLQGDLQDLNKALVAHNDQCGGIVYNKEDREAILKEREAAKK